MVKCGKILMKEVIRMSLIKELEIYFKDLIESLGFNIENVEVLPSSKKEFGDFQINVAMQLAKTYHKNPIDIANEIVAKMDDRFINVNIQGPGFINLTLSDKIVVDYLKRCLQDFNNFVDKVPKKKILFDYGGANVAKSLHVGHMRSANIGEALKRLTRLMGNDVISDVHLGDIGRQAGMIIYEIKLRNPELPYFDPSFEGVYPPLPYTKEELDKMYPEASIKASNDEKILEEVRKLTFLVDKQEKGYKELWDEIKKRSIENIKETYKTLNCEFDLWEGELDSYPYIPKTLEKMKSRLRESDGALVIDVKKDDDKLEVPPLIVIKEDGSTIYATRDLATIYSRVERFNPDEMIYITDNRQSLYFEQVFRASYLTNLVPSTTKLTFLGLGTMNGPDNKPFKTRDGKVVGLEELIQLVNKSTLEKTSDRTEEKEKTAKKIAIAALKYADLLPYRTTDYIFDIDKFNSLEGKTGPYILYTTVRIKSLLEKNKDSKIDLSILPNQEAKNIMLKLLELPKTLNVAYREKSLSYICDFLFVLCNLYNKLYNEHNITNEESIEAKSSLLAISKLVQEVNTNLLDVLAIEVPEKM